MSAPVAGEADVEGTDPPEGDAQGVGDGEVVIVAARLVFVLESHRERRCLDVHRLCTPGIQDRTRETTSGLIWTARLWGYSPVLGSLGPAPTWMPTR